MGGYYDSEEIQKLTDEINLLEYASQSLQFTKRGRDSYACSCPLHVDETPSLIITPSKNAFYCQSCRRGGSVIQWMMYYEGLTFREALKKVETITGHTARGIYFSEPMRVFRNFKKMSETKKTQAPSSRPVLSKDELLRFDDKILPQEWLDEGISPEEMRKYEIRIDRTANRIVYPVYDNQFRLIGIKGRTRYKNYKEMHLQKYMNYNKIGTVDYLTGMKQALPYVKASGQVIVVEGIKSVMKIDGWGYHNVVSAETSEINMAQVIILLQLGVKDVIIAFDKDVGIDKIKASARKFNKFVNVYMVYDRANLLDEKMSPCDKGREIWEMLYNRREKI